MNAQEQVAEAIAIHGRPMWVAHIPKRIVQEVDKNILKEMLEKAGKSVETMKVRDKYDYLLDWAAENVF
jgi:predicted XRE-type DNA-binding protein